MDKESQSPTPRYEMTVEGIELFNENPVSVEDSESEIHHDGVLQQNVDDEVETGMNGNEIQDDPVLEENNDNDAQSSSVGVNNSDVNDSGSEMQDGTSLEESDDRMMDDFRSEIQDGSMLQQNDGGEMMIAESSLARENHIEVYDPTRLPIQETGQILYQHPAQVGSNRNTIAFHSGATSNLEGVIIGWSYSNGQIEALVMSVETAVAIIAEL